METLGRLLNLCNGLSMWRLESVSSREVSLHMCLYLREAGVLFSILYISALLSLSLLLLFHTLLLWV